MQRAGLHLGFVLFKPAGNIEHFGDVMAGAAADAVGLFGNADENRFHVEKLECFVELLGFGNGRAIVSFAGHDQRGRFNFGDEIGERALHVVVGVIPGETGEPVFGDERDIRGEREAVPVDDRIERGCGAEALGVLDGPTGENAAAAAAGDEKIVGIDVALGDDGVDAAIEIVKIVAGISVMDEIGKILAIAGAAARIDVENHVAPNPADGQSSPGSCGCLWMTRRRTLRRGRVFSARAIPD